MIEDMEKSFRERLAEEFELPEPVLKNCPGIELSANRCAFIEGCKGIVEYSENGIELNLGSISARFCGTELEINSYDGENVLLSGNFSAISFN